MWYLILQIVLCLLLAVILGFLLGWILKIWPKRGQIDELRLKIDAMQKDYDAKFEALNKICISKKEEVNNRVAEIKTPNKIVIEKDDLKKIKGIYKVLEKFLNENGIYTFKEVALLSEKEVNRLADDLTGFQDRIKRDDWRTQAKKLHFDKYGERI